MIPEDSISLVSHDTDLAPALTTGLPFGSTSTTTAVAHW
jgi:hypothetical protein